MKPLLLVMLLATGAYANIVTLTMGEVSFQPINNLAVTKGGITFTFTDAGGGMNYDSANGGQLTYVQDPSIEGPNEPFSVAFSTPVYSVQFGIAVSQQSPSTPIPIASVSVYNGNTLVYTGTLNSSLTDPWVEGQFTYSSATPFTSITITPATNQQFTAIGFDNLAVDTAPVTVPTLSQTGMMLLFAAMLAMGYVVIRRGHLLDRRAA